MRLQRYFFILGILISMSGLYSPGAAAQARLWGTYYGGEKQESGGKVATDGAGNIYITGGSNSMMDIATANAFDPILEWPREAYLAKFDTNGKLIWATYYGDGNETVGKDLGLDIYGNIYVLGTAKCPSINLATPGAADPQCQGENDMFLAKFDPQGQRIWGTYFGGGGSEVAGAISVIFNGDVYLIGKTTSVQGIVPALSHDAILGGVSDAIVAKFNAQGQAKWARYLGGGKDDAGADVACRNSPVGDTCYATGWTDSVNGVATAGVHDSTLDGVKDAFLTRFHGADGKVAWTTFYGGSGYDMATSVVIDKKMNAYIGGITFSVDGMATVNAHDTTHDGIGVPDMFLAKFNADGVRQFATYYGNTDQERLFDLAMDSDNNLYVLGLANSKNGMVTPNPYDAILDGPNDAVLAKFNQVLVLLKATYYGGSSFEMGAGGGIAVDRGNHIHVLGNSSSSDAIATPGAHQTVNGGSNAFLVEFSQ